MTGYLHTAYATSLAEFGEPTELQQSGGWLLRRRIGDSSEFDMIGSYPLFCCSHWSRLPDDLAQLHDIVSISIVTDPFGKFDQKLLEECFPDLVKSFKEHFVTDLKQAPESFVHPHHQRNTLKALQNVRVEMCQRPREYLDEWNSLYQTLIVRHSITGIAAFSRESFAAQLQVPGMVAFRAVENGSTVGMLLWYEQGNRAYYHLGAYNQRGYSVGASFALFDHSIRYFANRKLAWLSLGAGAGVSGDQSGLDRFKQGWSTETRTVYFCGKIVNRDKYEELVRARNIRATDYFPAYRLGEFGS